jgi:hypothetical protein
MKIKKLAGLKEILGIHLNQSESAVDNWCWMVSLWFNLGVWLHWFG